MARLEFRQILALLILLTFVGALAFRYSQSLEETLKSIVGIAIGYFLGSSQSSNDKTQHLTGSVRKEDP